MNRSAASTARGALVGIATVVAERGAAFVVVLVLARTLSPDAFGRYGYVLAGMTLVQVLADQGIEVAAVAAMSAARTAIPTMLGGALLLRVLVWLLVAIPVGGLVLPALASGADTDGLARAGLAASGLVLVGGSISLRGVLRAQGAMGAMARVALVDALLGGGAVVVTARAGGSVAAIFAARVLASLLVTSGVLVLGPHRPTFGSGLRSTLQRLVAVAAPLGGNALLIAIHTRAGHLVAMALAGPTMVGLLGAAARVTEVLGVLPEGALLAVFPRMAAGPAEAPALAAAAARRLAALVLVFVVVLGVGATSVTSALFGTAYAPAAPAVATLAWIGVFAVTGGVTVHAIVARNAERVLLPANLLAACAGIALQVMWIRASGLEGAALATVATAALGQVALSLSPVARPIVLGVWRAVSPLVAIAAVVVAVGRHVRPDLVGAVAAAAGYALVVGATGLIGREDWVLVRRALGWSPGS